MSALIARIDRRLYRGGRPNLVSMLGENANGVPVAPGAPLAEFDRVAERFPVLRATRR